LGTVFGVRLALPTEAARFAASMRCDTAAPFSRHAGPMGSLATSDRSLPPDDEFRQLQATRIAGGLSDGFRRKWRGLVMVFRCLGALVLRPPRLTRSCWARLPSWA